MFEVMSFQVKTPSAVLKHARSSIGKKEFEENILESRKLLQKDKKNKGYKWVWFALIKNNF